MIEKLDLDLMTSEDGSELTEIERDYILQDKINEIIDWINAQGERFFSDELINKTCQETGFITDPKSVNCKEPRPDILHVCKRTDEIRNQTLDDVLGKIKILEHRHKTHAQQDWKDLKQLLTEMREGKK